MKKLGAILLTFSLIIALFPQLTMAAQDTSFEQDLTNYLQQVSSERGFEVTKEDLEMILSYFDESLENYDYVSELSDFLGEVIKADYSNLAFIYEEYELNEETLIQLLQENGEELSDYIFVDDLDSAVYFYTEDGVFERDPNFDEDLVAYLANVSEQRGFNVTKEDIEKSLATFESSLEDFETVEDLNHFLGEVIKADYSNLDYFYETYDLTQQDLFSLIEENGESINDYIFIDDLELLVFDEDLSGMLDFADEDFELIFEQIGLSDEELERLENHILSFEEEFSNLETLERLLQLFDEMSLLEFDENTEATPELIAQVTSFYEELFSIFHLNATYSLVNGDKETPISLEDLMKIEDMKGASVKVSLYSLDGEFLADFIITEEFILSQFPELGEEIMDSVGEVANEPEVKTGQQLDTKTDEHQTVKGGKLPITATNYIPNALLGLFIVMLGLFFFRKVRNA